MSKDTGRVLTEWRRVCTSPYRNYEVSSDGRIRRGNKELRGVVDRQGYRSVLLSYAGLSRRFKLHRLVCEAFHGPAPSGADCAHGDGNPSNNAASNLRWASRAENMRDAAKHGTLATTLLPGERHPQAKLSAAQVSAIRASASPHRAIAREYGVGEAAIRKIRKGDTWK